jgi:M6 family metalloprotease-like protein
MKFKISALLAATMLSSALIANAIPALRDKRVITQPDGTTLTVHMVGDEHSHFLLTEDNKVLIEDENGQYSYATIKADGTIESTKIRALDPSVRPVAHNAFTQSIDDIDLNSIGEKRVQARKARRANSVQSGMGTYASFPKKGDIKGLVILVEFKNQSFSSGYYSISPLQYFTDMMSKEGFSEYGGTGCAQEYFKQQSLNQFRPKFDVVGPYKLSQNVANYGENDSYGYDKNAEDMIVEACQLADNDVDFSQYDNDGDGYCDNVFVFYAGLGENSGGSKNTVWPHSYNLSETNKSITLDGVKIDRYACSNEVMNGRPDGVGTFVHEFSHVMGLPDLYNTTQSGSYYTPCTYSVLDYGPYNNNSCTPPAYSVFERNAMEWIDLKELDGAETITLGNIADTNEGCLIETETPTEFYLLENRQQTGWDAYIPGHGMIIWHIDYNQKIWQANTVNNNSSHQYVDLIEASGQTNGESMSSSIMAGWTWPGTSGKTEFTSATSPALQDWSGNAIDLPITDITEEDGNITFKVAGGSDTATPVPDKDSDIEKGENYFVASWSAVEDANDYMLWVYGEIEKSSGSTLAADKITETADMGTGITVSLPDGWTSSSLGAYSGATNCGDAIPAAKFESTGSYILTRTYTDEQVVGVSFWMKGLNTSENSNFLVEGLVDNNWVTLGKFVPVKGEGNTFSVSDMPDGVKQVKFTYTKDKGNIAVDDIVISLESNYTTAVLPDYDGILTDGATSVRVDKLIEGCNRYKFKVASTKDWNRYSKPSELSYVFLNEAGVNDIIANRNFSTISVNDRTITVNTDADRVDVYNTQGRHILSQHVSDDSCVLNLPTAGLYIVRTGNTATKVVVR